MNANESNIKQSAEHDEVISWLLVAAIFIGVFAIAICGAVALNKQIRTNGSKCGWASQHGFTWLLAANKKTNTWTDSTRGVLSHMELRCSESSPKAGPIANCMWCSLRFPPLPVSTEQGFLTRGQWMCFMGSTTKFQSRKSNSFYLRIYTIIQLNRTTTQVWHVHVVSRLTFYLILVLAGAVEMLTLRSDQI